MNRKRYKKKYNKSKKHKLNILKRNVIILTLSVFCILSIVLFFNSFSSNANSNNNAVSYKYYKSIEIQKGDTLWSIADMYMDDEHYKNKLHYIHEVKEINSLESDRIVSGRRIVIPYYSYEYL